jgi:UDP-N-acetylglucosamine 1-carboxyvinyltransferase
LDRIQVFGGIPLCGKVSISGAKNAALPIVVATLLTKDQCVISNVPSLLDIKTILRLMDFMGAKTRTEEKENVLKIQVDADINPYAPYDLVKTMRASILVLGPLLARFGYAKVSLPGGCAIGARPVNLHLMGLEKMGAEICIDKGYIIAKAENGLKGAYINLDIPTVTGTENLLMAASLASGETVIENAAREPEVVDLVNMLRSMGVKIKGDGTGTITVLGLASLLKGTEYEIIPDRVEAGTYLTAATLTGGELTVENCIPSHLTAVIEKLEMAGATIQCMDNAVEIKGPGSIFPTDVITAPYPGFPTDLQAQFMTLMCVAKGTSLVSETVFENRFIHVCELDRLGANIKIDGHTAIIKGVNQLCGAPVMATDLRASACLILAGLVAKGKTVIHRVYHLDRGYERMEVKLQNLGARINRLS